MAVKVAAASCPPFTREKRRREREGERERWHVREAELAESWEERGGGENRGRRKRDNSTSSATVD